MTSDAVFKVGRGGAGNYYTQSQQDGPVPAAENSPDEPQVQPSSSGPQVRTTGRGGAGNIAPDAPVPAASSSGNRDDEEKRSGDAGPEATQATQAVLMRESHATRMGRLGGRGGAGNWLEKSPTRAKEREKQSDEEKDELERKVRETVDEGLKMPEKAHSRVRRGHKA